MNVDIKVNHEKCSGCGTCVDICPAGVYKIQNGKPVPVNVNKA